MKLDNNDSLVLIDGTCLLYLFGMHSNFKRLIINYLDTIQENTGATRYIGFIDGPSSKNYRYTVEETYKQNRDKSKITDKFPYFYEVKDFLINTLKFAVVSVLEVDDALSVIATHLNEEDSKAILLTPIFTEEENEEEFKCNIKEEVFTKASTDFIIASADKDLAQIPCYLYNLTHGSLNDNYDEYIGLSNNRKKVEASGRYLLYLQCMTGDSADNIKGIPNYGPVKSYNALKDVLIDELELEVLKHYEQYYGKQQATTEFKKTYDLVYLPKKIKSFNLSLFLFRFSELSHLTL